MTPGIYSGERGKFHIGDELVICNSAGEFVELVKEHMGIEAAEYLTYILDALVGYEEGDSLNL